MHVTRRPRRRSSRTRSPPAPPRRSTEGNQTATSIPYPQIAASPPAGRRSAPAATPSSPTSPPPGVAILAAVAPPSNSGPELRLLLRYVDGRPARRRSGRPLVRGRRAAEVVADEDQVGADDDGGRPGRRRRQQGHRPVRAGRRPGACPSKMLDPGLVYPAGDRDWLRLPGGPRRTTPAPASRPSTRATTTLRRSRSGRCSRRQTVTRRVTAVKPGLYRARREHPGRHGRRSARRSWLQRGRARPRRSGSPSPTSSADFDEAASRLPHLEGCRHARSGSRWWSPRRWSTLPMRWPARVRPAGSGSP